MKKLSFLMGALVALTIGFTSCDDDNNGPVGNIVEDGFYVVGEATAFASLDAQGSAAATMSAGRNENAKNELREGMYEKYMLLEGGKPFQLVLKKGSEQVVYGADLKDVALNGNDQPAITIQRGAMVKDATLQVPANGLYHIVLDLNLAGDLASEEIIVAPVEWGVRGGMNGWGFTAGTATEFNKNTITYTWENQNLAAGGEFKFAYGGGWKIELNELADATAADDPRYIKANTNLGADCVPGADNIKVEAAGAYKITLTYTLKAGEIKDSYAMNIELTQASSTPTEMYMIGADFGNWNWEDAGIVSLVPVHSHEGQFWTIKYFNAANGFKFCAKKEWNGDFTGLGTDNGYEQKDGNCFVPADGLYIVVVDLLGKALTIEPAVVYGMGDVFGGWDAAMEAAKFATSADGKTLSIAAPKDGNLRMYAHSSVLADWWQHEFNIYDGKIVYRADGGDQEAVAVTAGQTITLDFATETGSIK